MDYNQLKVRILCVLDEEDEYDSLQIRERLEVEGVFQHGEKALKMALMRYWRQGLLARARKGRRFYYRLTERGVARKAWLLRSQGSTES